MSKICVRTHVGDDCMPVMVGNEIFHRARRCNFQVIAPDEVRGQFMFYCI